MHLLSLAHPRSFSRLQERSLLLRSYRANMHRLAVTDAELALLLDAQITALDSPKMAVADSTDAQEALAAAAAKAAAALSDVSTGDVSLTVDGVDGSVEADRPVRFLSFACPRCCQ